MAQALVKTKNPGVFDVLAEVVDDEEITAHVLAALKKVNPIAAEQIFQRYAQDNRALVRRYAKLGLEKIRKNQIDDRTSQE